MSQNPKFGKFQGMLVLAAIAAGDVSAPEPADPLKVMRAAIFKDGLDVTKPADNQLVKTGIRNILKQGGFDPTFVDGEVDLSFLDDPNVWKALKLLNDNVQFVADYTGIDCCFKSFVSYAIASENA
jgi:hypothetical protein